MRLEFQSVCRCGLKRLQQLLQQTHGIGWNDMKRYDIKASEMADMINLSYSYFSRIFKEIKGYAPSEYYEKHVVPNLPFKKKKD